MAKTANQTMTRRDCGRRPISAAAATVLYGGCAAFLNAAGNAINTIGAGASVFAGIVQESGIDNSAGAAGDKSGWCYAEGVFLLTGSGFAQTDVGQRVYWTDNYTLTLTAAGNVLAGTIEEVESSTQVWVDIETDIGPSDTIADVDATAINSGDAGTDTVITSLRTKLNAVLAVLEAQGITRGA